MSKSNQIQVSNDIILLTLFFCLTMITIDTTDVFGLPFHHDNSMTNTIQFIPKTYTDKPFRQLPCRSYIATGTCPYYDRCVFLHDPRIQCFTATQFSVKVFYRLDDFISSIEIN
jgi:hypothetical protein